MKLKYLQLNVWRGGEMLDGIIDFIKSENPDVVALQEVYNGKDQDLPRQFRTVEILRKELSYSYYDYAPAFLDSRSIGKIQSGNAVFSKFPIINFGSIFYRENYREVSEESDFQKKENFEIFTTYPRNLQRVEIDLNDKKINIFNTHGVWGFDAEDNERRLEMSEKIVNWVKSKQNVILSGDLNVKEDTQTIKNIEKYLSNVFKGELKTTFNTNIKNDPGFHPEVVDFVFVSNEIKALGRYCPKANISDHMPLVCLLEI